jgi:hypothetical protein
MQFIKPTLCALAVLTAAATATAQTGYGRYYNRMYVRGGWAYGTRDYYYGPDGYHARWREKNKCDENGKRMRPYGYNQPVTKPVFKRAKYAEDTYGRPYLYLASEK